MEKNITVNAVKYMPEDIFFTLSGIDTNTCCQSSQTSQTGQATQKPAEKIFAIPEIKNVIFNKPATIVIWADDTKTVVKAQGRDRYSKDFGLAMCIVKKLKDNKGNYNDIFKKWCEQ